MAHGQAPFPAMTTSRDAPNPLRPYYVPPSIGLPPDAAANTTTAAARGGAPTTSSIGIGSSARDMFNDFDYGGPLFDTDSPSVAEMAKKLLDQAVWKYTSVLLAQPFDVAKTILQVRLAAAAAAAADADDTLQDLKRRQSSRFSDRRYQDDPLSASETESDQDEPSYFTSTKPSHQDPSSPSRKSRRRRQTPDSTSGRSTPVAAPSSSSAHKLHLRRPDSILDTIGQLWQHDGATGLWKATNASFIYTVLGKAVESWTRSLLSALLNLPDPAALAGDPSEVVAGALGGLNVADSPSPLTSLAIAVAASAIAGLLLAPLDLVRTRLILTPTSSQPRAILPLIRQLPSLTVPSSLLPVTILHSSLPTLITSSAPLVLRQYLRIDPLTTPATYSLATFLASTGELFLKLPLETVLRRGQVHVIKSQHARDYNAARYQSFKANAKLASPDLDTVVDPGPYKGILGTMWYVAKEEGTRDPSALASATSTPARPSSQAQKKQKKGQGIAGLWRGWRVGMWGLVGVWGASALGGGGRTEF